HRHVLLPTEELVDVPVGLVPGVAVALLDTSDQLVVVPFGYLQVVVGEFPPLFLDVAFELVPVAFEHVAVHGVPPSVVQRRRTLASPSGSLAAARPSDVRTEPGHLGRTEYAVLDGVIVCRMPSR